MGRQMRFGVGSVVVVVAMLVWSGSALAAVKTTLTFTGGSPAISGALPVQSYAWGIDGGSGTGPVGRGQFQVCAERRALEEPAVGDDADGRKADHAAGEAGTGGGGAYPRAARWIR